MNHLISMFIDDELDIDDKIAFIESVERDRSYKQETIELLHQEKELRSDVVDYIPTVDVKPVIDWKKNVISFLRPVSVFASGLAAALIIIWLFTPSQQSYPIPNRFVIYRPDIKRAEITGSFIDWKKLPMQQIGNSGYWEITLTLPEGEHRFTYILDSTKRFADPTIPAREMDDFGGQNSILQVRKKA